MDLNNICSNKCPWQTLHFDLFCSLVQFVAFGPMDQASFAVAVHDIVRATVRSVQLYTISTWHHAISMGPLQSYHARFLTLTE